MATVALLPPTVDTLNKKGITYRYQATVGWGWLLHISGFCHLVIVIVIIDIIVIIIVIIVIIIIIITIIIIGIIIVGIIIVGIGMLLL